MDALLELAEERVDVLFRDELDHDLELLDLDVGRVVVLAEEDAHLVREGARATLQDEVDVAQRDPLDLGRRRDERDCGRARTASQLEVAASE